MGFAWLGPTCQEQPWPSGPSRLVVPMLPTSWRGETASMPTSHPDPNWSLFLPCPQPAPPGGLVWSPRPWSISSHLGPQARFEDHL